METRQPLVALAALLITACASNPPAPNDRIAVAQEAVRRAEQNRAGELAPAQLELARRKLNEARERVAREDKARYDEARRLAEQAAVDAQLAESEANARKITRIERGVQRDRTALPPTEVDHALTP